MKFSFIFTWTSLFLLHLGMPDTFVQKTREVFAISSSFRPLRKEETKPSFVQKDQLLLENQRLNENLDALYEWLLFESRLEEELDTLQKVIGKFEHEEEILRREFLHRRVDELKRIVDLQSHALMGKVIHRSPNSWGSSLWISLGSKDNARVEQPVVQKHSPVMAGPYLVGLIEEVEEERSRVRLISDSGLVIAVRAIRGKPADEELLKRAKAFKEQIAIRDGISNKEVFLHLLSSLEQELQEERSYYLAKGELYGKSSPIWDLENPTLHGSGFQYEFPDADGEFSAIQEELIRTGDLLVTSGLDGIFPSGLMVASVSKIEPMNQERYYYSIEAKPCAPTMNELQYLFVLPPIDQ